MHHGRKGQQWGVQNGPPYPLDQTNKEYKRTQSKNDKIEADIDKLIESKKLITESNATSLVRNGGEDKKRVLEAADLGLKALNKIGRDGYDEKEGIHGPDREWFIFEDQTKGCFTVADLVNKGADKSFINKLIEQADNSDYEKHYEPGYFQLRERDFGDDYIDALISLKNEESKKR